MWPRARARIIAIAALLSGAVLLAQSADVQADGIKALDAKQYETAAGLFQQEVANQPKDYAAHFYLALAYSLLGKNAEAIPEYKTTLDLKPGLYDAELNLGICLLRTKDASGAAPFFKSAAAQKPTEFRPAYYFAEALLEQKQFPDAESAFKAALAIDGSSASAEIGLGEAIAHQGRPGEAEPHYRKAAALDPSYKSQLLELGELYEQQHQLPQAIAIYREFPENPGAQERMGELLSQTGHSADAIPALESAVAKSPTTANQMALAQAYLDNKELDKADRMAAQAVASQPESYDLRMYYGRMLRDQRRFGEAAPQFLAAAKLKPNEVHPWNELAGVMLTAEQYPQALVALDRARALGGETSAHYYLRALALDHLHQLKDALANYKKFLEMSQGKSPDEEFKARQRARIIQNELNNKR